MWHIYKLKSDHLCVLQGKGWLSVTKEEKIDVEVWFSWLVYEGIHGIVIFYINNILKYDEKYVDAK